MYMAYGTFLQTSITYVVRAIIAYFNHEYWSILITVTHHEGSVLPAIIATYISNFIS